MPRYMVLYARVSEVLVDDGLFVVELTPQFATQLRGRREWLLAMRDADPDVIGICAHSPADLYRPDPCVEYQDDGAEDADPPCPIPKATQKIAQHDDVDFVTLDTVLGKADPIRTDCDEVEVLASMVLFRAARKHWDCPDRYEGCVYWDQLEPELQAVLAEENK